MRKIPLALIVLASLCGSASADLGDPTVQAVCRIKLTNGRVIEGFITVAAGGYGGTHPSGFRFHAGSEKATHFLNVDFKRLTRESHGNYRIVFNGDRVASGSALRKPSRIVFLDWQVETINDQEHQQYKDLDALTIVTELPYHLYIDEKSEGLERGSVITIPLKKIVSFELIDHPAKRWLDHIRERREVGSEVLADAEDLTEPDWYHEIRRHKEFVPVEYSPPKYAVQDLSPLVRQLNDQNHGSFLRIKAARSLRDLGPRAKPAIPALIKALNDREDAVGFFAAKALVKLGPAAVAGLADALKSEYEKLRTGAVRLLLEIGPNAQSAAIPVLFEALKDPNNNIRRNATYSLVELAYAAVELRPLTQAAIPALIDLLKDQDVSVRQAAAFALGALSLNARATVPALTEALKDRDPSFRQSAAAALLRIEPESKEAVAALIAALKDSDGSVRQAAAHTLGFIKQSKEAVNGLIAVLKDADPSVRQSAVNALGNIGEAALPGLSDALKDQDQDLRDGAVRALTFMGARQKAAIPVLIEALKNHEIFVRLSAVNLLAGFGKEAKAAVPALIAALNDQNKDVRNAASKALVAIGLGAKDAVPVLIDKLKDEDAFIRGTAARVIESIGREAKAAVPALLGALKDQDPVVRNNAVKALAATAPEASEVVPTLIEGLKSPTPLIRITFATALQNIGRAAKAAVPALSDALSDHNLEVRRASLSALQSIGLGVANVPALIEALNDSDPSIRIAATVALKSLKKSGQNDGFNGFNYTGYNNYGAYTESRTTPELQAAMPALVAALKAENTQVRVAASVALRDIRPDAHAVVPLLIEALTDESPPVRANIAVLLGRQGIFATAAVPSMIRLMKDPDHEVVIAAASALADVGPAAKLARDGLLALLSHPNPGARAGAATGLASIRLKDAAVVAALIRLLKDKDVDVRAKAVEALTLIDDGGRTIPAFIAGLKDPEDRLRSDFEAALVEIGEPAVPALVRAVKLGSSNVRAAAARAIERIQLDTESLLEGSAGVLIARVMRLRPVVNNKPSDLTLYEMVADYSRHRGAYNIKPGRWDNAIHFEYEDYQQRRFAAEWGYDRKTNTLYPSRQVPVSAYSGLWEYDAKADKAYPRDSLKTPAFWVPVQPYCCKSGSAPQVDR